MGAFTSCMAPPAPQRSVPARRLPGPFENQAPLNENSRPNRLDGLADSGLHGGLGTGNDGPNRLVPTPQPDHEEHRRAEDQSTDEDDVRTKLPDRRAPQITPHPQIWNWKKGPQLGNGSFGTVYLGINSDTGGLMAVKQVEQPVVEDERTRNKLMASVRELEREVETLQKLRHPNIVQYYGIERTAKYINIFLEWVPGGSIRDLLNKFGVLSDAIRLRISCGYGCSAHRCCCVPSAACKDVLACKHHGWSRSCSTPGL